MGIIRCSGVAYVLYDIFAETYSDCNMILRLAALQVFFLDERLQAPES